MTEFDEFIKRAQSNGLSFEDIAANFTKALNEAQAANKSKEKREAILSQGRKQVLTAANEGKWDFNIAAIVAMLAAAALYPTWSAADLEGYRDIVREAIEEAAEYYDSLIQDKGGTFLDDIGTLLNKMLGGDDDDNRDDKVLKAFVKKL